jgi:formylglycine-generating enzyme required for sulfatase activity
MNHRLFCLLLGVLLLPIGALSAEEEAVVTVFRHAPRRAAEAEALAGRLRELLTETGRLRLVSTERLRKVREDFPMGCGDVDCAWFVGRETGARLVIAGTLNCQGRDMAIQYLLVRARERAVLKKGEVACPGGLENLEEAVRKLAWAVVSEPDEEPPEQWVETGREGPRLPDFQEWSFPWEQKVAPGDENGHEFVRIPGGEYWVGSSDPEAPPEEQPRHRVYLFPFALARAETTRRQFQTFLEETGHTPRYFDPNVTLSFPRAAGLEQHPACLVSWDDATAYCLWLSRRTGQTYRLPTEAEWEAAATGQVARIYPWGDDFDQNTAYCNYIGLHLEETSSAGPKTRPVGSFREGTGPFGLLDMAGNVWEWCRDYYDPRFYRRSPYENPVLAECESCRERVIRGGAWNSSRRYLRCTARGSARQNARQPDLGFRPARVEKDAEAPR